MRWAAMLLRGLPLVLAAMAPLAAVLAYLWATPCAGDLLPRPLRLNHYRYRSFEEYHSRRGSPWKYWQEAALAYQCEDREIQRLLPEVEALRALPWLERRRRHHQGPFCVLGLDGVRECRPHFLVAVAWVNGEDGYLREWLDFHSVVGVDHFLLYDAANSSATRALLAPYVEHGAVTYFEHSFGAFDRRVPGAGPCYRCHSHSYLQKRAFWLGNFELDEFFFPSRGDSIREVLLPLAEAKTAYGAVAVPWQVFSGAPFLWPPGSQLQHYVRVEQRREKRYTNGKSLALLDALRQNATSADPGHTGDGGWHCCYPHRVPLRRGWSFAPAHLGIVSGKLQPQPASLLAWLLERDAWQGAWVHLQELTDVSGPLLGGYLLLWLLALLLPAQVGHAGSLAALAAALGLLLPLSEALLLRGSGPATLPGLLPEGR